MIEVVQNEVLKSEVNMDWLQVLVLLGGNFAMILPLWLWSRSEANADRRELHGIMEDFRKDNKEFREKWAQESKEFHGRLCEIEAERNKK